MTKLDPAPVMLEPVDVAADMAGNIYVLVQVRVSPARTSLPSLVRIAPDGTLTSLIGKTWFGHPSSTENASRIEFASGFTVDRAGNLYFTIPARGAAASILKITPAGVVTTLTALPAGLNADMNGNTYRYDAATSRLLRTAPDGTTIVETGVQSCADLPAGSTAGCLDAYTSKILPVSGASLVTLGSRVNRVVPKH